MATIAAPNSVNYADQFPLGIEATSHRRLFFPSTGDKYAPDGSNIIRIDINYDGLLDTSQSYLMFNLKNTSTKKLKQDLGQPIIKRLRVESGGVVLEDIQNYNQLLGGILVPSQGGVGNVHTETFNLTCGINSSAAATQSSMFTGAVITPLSDNSAHTASNPSGILAAGGDVQCCYKLVSGLLDNDKYLPLVLMNAGLTIQIELAPANEIGTTAKTTGVDNSYEVSGVRYVGHLIDLQRDFYTAMRGAQQQAGGNLTIAGTSFRSFSGAFEALATSVSINVPARVRSIKSVFFKLSTATKNSILNLSCGSHGNLTSYQLKIGATNYPPTAINVNATTNKIEPYLELQKAFGKLGSTVHSDLLGAGSYLILEDIDIDWAETRALSFAPFGIDLESFRHEIENGVDTSTRSLPMTLTLTGSGATKKLTVDVFVMYDALFYVDMNGAVNVSS